MGMNLLRAGIWARTYSGFISQWRTTTPNETLTMPFTNNGVYNCTIDWGDGSPASVVTAWDSPNKVHTYAAAGYYDVEIKGEAPGFNVNGNAEMRDKLYKIIYWGDSEVFGGFASAENLFYYCINLHTIEDDRGILFKPTVTSGYRIFKDCRALKYIHLRIFENMSANTTTFQEAMHGNCELEEVPPNLFDKFTLVGNNGFRSCFANCRKIKTLPVDLFRFNTLVGNNGFWSLLYGATLFKTIPQDLFKYNTNVKQAGFEYAFMGTLVDEIPVDLFRFNTLVDGNAFGAAFYGTKITSVPEDIYRYNTEIITCNSFQACSLLETLPADLFYYNTKIIYWNTCFKDCVKLQLRADIFYRDGQQATRFLNKSPNFIDCFNRTSFSGTQGTAPDLWNCDFGSGTPVKTRTYAGNGNSETSLTNYTDIPSDWKT